jgi:hypothetical protein
MWYQKFIIHLKMVDTSKANIMEGIEHSFFLHFYFFLPANALWLRACTCPDTALPMAEPEQADYNFIAQG